jgi:hypothetical protein
MHISAHKSKAYEGYAKRTEKRALAATRERRAHRIAMAQSEAEASSDMQTDEIIRRTECLTPSL